MVEKKMTRMTRMTLDEISSEESYKMSQAEFKGMVIQSLKDIKEDVAELKQQNNITRWISFGVAGIAGILSGRIGKGVGF